MKRTSKENTQVNLIEFIEVISHHCRPTSTTVSPPQTFPPKLVMLDFGDMDSLPDAILEIMDCYGCLDILILNSSMKVKAPAQSLSLEMDKLLMDNNYFGPATLAKGRGWPPAGLGFRLLGCESLGRNISWDAFPVFRCAALHDLQENRPPAPGQQHPGEAGRALPHDM